MPEAKELTRLHDQLVEDQRPWHSEFQKANKFLFPHLAYLGTEERPDLPPSQYEQIFSSSPRHASQLLASSLFSALTDPTKQWFRWSLGSNQIDEIPFVGRWLDEATEATLRIFSNSNFYRDPANSYYRGIASIGNSVMYMPIDLQTTVRFESWPIHEVAIRTKSDGRVNAVFRKSKWTGKQIMGRFNRVPKRVEESVQNDAQDKFTVRTGVIENGPEDIDVVLWMDEDILEQGKADEFPVSVARTFRNANDPWGFGLGLIALPDIMMLDEMERITIRSAEKQLDPPLFLPHRSIASRDGKIKTSARAINWVDSSLFRTLGTTNLIETLPPGDVGLGLEMIERKRLEVRQAFFNDRLILEDNPEMTATEVIKREATQGRLLGPIVNEVTGELDIILARVLRAGLRMGTIPSPPEEIADSGIPLEIQYKSNLTNLQEAEDVVAMLNYIQAVAPIIETNPDAVDWFNPDEIMPALANSTRVPKRFIRAIEEVTAIRQQRAQQQQAEQLTQTGIEALKASPQVAA